MQHTRRSIRTDRRPRGAVLRVERMEDRVCLSGLTPGLGVAYPANGNLNFFIDNRITGQADVVRAFGRDTDIPVVGDFTGSTLSSIGIYRPSTGEWGLDLTNNGTASKVVVFGGPGWTPITGDVDGNGTTDLGVYNNATGVWMFCTDLSGRASQAFSYGGSPGDVPLLMDFNHDGRDDPIIYNGGQWLVDTNADRLPDQVYNFGGFAPTATPQTFDLFGTHDPVLAVAVPQPNGRVLWYINPSRDGVTVGQYQSVAPIGKPFTGFFSTTDSIFVNPATGRDGAGAGSYYAPYRTINAAVAASRPGTTIRLMAGAYVESVRVVGKSDLKFVGTGMQSSVVYPSSGDAFFLQNSSRITLDDLWLYAGGNEGRGLVAVSSSVDTGMIRTNLTRKFGLLAVGSNGSATTINARYSRFDGVQIGHGAYLDQSANGVFIGCSFSDNGLSPDYQGYVGGLVVNGNSTARIDSSLFINNRFQGLTANSTGRVEMTNSYLARTFQGNAAIFFDASTAILIGNCFAESGTVFGAVTGFNGIEFAQSFTGYAQIERNQFLSNTASGIYIASAPNTMRIAGNVFSGNWMGIFMYLESSRPVNAQIVGNYFVTPVDLAVPSFGVGAVGSQVNAQVGGEGADQNIFDDFRDRLSIHPDHMGGAPPTYMGCPNFMIGGNIFRRRGQILSQAQAVGVC